MMNRRLACVLSVVLPLVALGLVQVALAQGGGDPHHINRWTLGASAGGVLTSTSFLVAGTTAQANTDLSASPDRYNTGGIWTPHYIDPYPYQIDDPEPPVIPTIAAPTPVSPDDIPEPEEPATPGTDIIQGMSGGNYFPETLNLPGCPNIDPPLYTPTVSLPVFQPLDPPSYPTTLGLPAMPTLTLQSYITKLIDPVYSMTYAILSWDTIITSSLFMPQGLADAAGIGIDGFEGGSGSASMNIELAGYTATEIADELVGGIDTALSYIRSIEQIGVIGPTAAALIVGISWIAFIAFAKIVIKALMMVVHFVVEIWRLLPFM